jgi:hypothetical protein
LLWVRRSTAERPSPLRVCSQLDNNKLTGSVPSSLSALRLLEDLCVPRSCHRRLRVRPRRVRIGRLCSEQRGMSGGACLGHRAGAVRQQGLLRYSQRGPSGTRCDYRVLSTPSYGYGARVPTGAHGCCGRGVVPPERPSPLRVCSYLRNNELTGSVPSSLSTLTNLSELCVPPSSQRRLRVRLRRVGIGRERAACRGMHVGGIERGRCGSRADAVRSEGTSGTRCDYGVLKGPSIPCVRCAGTVGAHGCCGCGVAPPSGRVRFGCAAPSTTIS